MNETTPTRTVRSLAADSLRNGQAMLGRSFRMHRPRGGFCHDGWCQQCKVELSDGRVVLACQESCSDKVAIRPRSAVRRVLGWVAESQPPWFYESRFLKPAFLRQFYLKLLRHLSGALSLPRPTPSETNPWQHLDCDVLVVGGGAAGLGAATHARRAGSAVVVVDATRTFVSTASDLRKAIEEAEAAGVVILRDTLCVGLYEAPRRALCIDPRGAIVVRHRELVVATGAYDRLIPFRNNDLPGIVGVRALEILAAQDALPEHGRIGIYGESAEVDRAVDTLQRVGRRASWVAGPAQLPATPPETARYPDSRIAQAHGRRTLRGIMLDDGRRLSCDLLVLGFSQPTYELQMQRQSKLAIQGTPATLVTDGSGPGFRVVGAAASVAGRVSTGLSQHSDAFICPCEDVRVADIERAIADGYRDVELIKRHTGAATGPCQGKLCHANLLECLSLNGVEPRLPTQRPLVRPVTLAQFAGGPEEAP